MTLVCGNPCLYMGQHVNAVFHNSVVLHNQLLRQPYVIHARVNWRSIWIDIGSCGWNVVMDVSQWCMGTWSYQSRVECVPIMYQRIPTRKDTSWLHFTRNCHSIQIDLQFTRDVSHMVAWAVDYVIQHYYETQHWHVVHNRPWIHTQVSWLHSPVNCHNYSIRPSIDPWCITYGYLGTLWCDKTLLSIQHSHVVP